MQVAKLMGALALMAGSTVAGAQDWGDARQGLRYAQKMCAECHAVSARQPRSPVPDAPPFQAIANTPSCCGSPSVTTRTDEWRSRRRPKR